MDRLRKFFQPEMIQISHSDPRIETEQFISSNVWTMNSMEYAIYTNDIALVKKIINSGFDVNYDHGLPLFLAVQAGNSEIVHYLLESGANPNYYESPFYPLIYATRDLNYDIIRDLLEHGADPNTSIVINGEIQVPLMYARTKEIQNLLFDYGAKI